MNINECWFCVLRIWNDACGAEGEFVTHWRELPDPPRMEGEI